MNFSAPRFLLKDCTSHPQTYSSALSQWFVRSYCEWQPRWFVRTTGDFVTNSAQFPAQHSVAASVTERTHTHTHTHSCTSLICDSSVTTQNVRGFFSPFFFLSRRSFYTFWSAIIFYECNDDTTALQRRVLQTALWHYTRKKRLHLQTFLSIPITQKCQILSCDTLIANERYVCVGILRENYLVGTAADGRITFSSMSVDVLWYNRTEMARSVDRICGGDNGTSNAGQRRLNFITSLGPWENLSNWPLNPLTPNDPYRGSYRTANL